MELRIVNHRTEMVEADNAVEARREAIAKASYDLHGSDYISYAWVSNPKEEESE